MTKRPIKHALVVCNNPIDRSSLSKTLASSGFMVHSRTSPADAAAREQECKHVDLAVLDLHDDAPDVETYASTLHARHPRLPLVLITSREQLSHLKNPIVDIEYLPTPVTPESLLHSFIY